MKPFLNPALAAFIGSLGDGVDFGPVRVARPAEGFALRHVADLDRADATLRPVAVDQLRALANLSAEGAFRPNKAAPNLVRGWSCTPRGPEELELALDALVPGGLADWHALLTPPTPVCHYREFAERQTGMYRHTAALSDPEAAEVLRACCDARFCTRRRLWSVGDAGPEEPAGKSVVPCLEPCALLLDLARRAERMGREERATLRLGPGDLATLAAALEVAAAHADPDIREGDTGHPANPRRLRLLREKLLPWLPDPAALREE
jgi:hypothetical protein